MTFRRTAVMVMVLFTAFALSSTGFSAIPAKQAAKSENKAPVTPRSPKILVVLTGIDRVPQSDHNTGFWAEEFVVPVELFKHAGYQVTAASIHGGRAPVDPASIDPKGVGADEARLYRAMLDKHTEFQRCVPLGKITAGKFAAIFVVGGHGVMWDLTGSPDVARLVRGATARRTIVSAVCHGPGALLGIAMANGSKFLAGKNVTGFSAVEEEMAGMSKTVPYCLEKELAVESQNLYSRAAKPWASHVVVNDGLILGQNPGSSRETAQAVIKQLAQQRRHR